MRVRVRVRPAVWGRFRPDLMEYCPVAYSSGSLSEAQQRWMVLLGTQELDYYSESRPGLLVDEVQEGKFWSETTDLHPNPKGWHLMYTLSVCYLS